MGDGNRGTYVHVDRGYRDMSTSFGTATLSTAPKFYFISPAMTPAISSSSSMGTFFMCGSKAKWPPSPIVPPKKILAPDGLHLALLVLALRRRAHEADVRGLDLAAGVRAARPVDPHGLRRFDERVDLRHDPFRDRFRLNNSQGTELRAGARNHGALD